MKKLVYVFFTIALLSGVVSCSSDDSDDQDGMETLDVIVGKWQLVQDFTNDGLEGPLQEVELTDCEKETIIEIEVNGSFKDTSIEDGFDGSGCETYIANGTWQEAGDGEYRLTFNASDIETGDAVYGDAEIENNQLILIYDFPSLDGGVNIIDKLIYKRVQ